MISPASADLPLAAARRIARRLFRPAPLSDEGTVPFLLRQKSGQSPLGTDCPRQTSRPSRPSSAATFERQQAVYPVGGSALPR